MDDIGPGGTQSISRAIGLLLEVSRAGPGGARLSDLVVSADLPKATVRRLLLALVHADLLEQDETTRRYHIGPEIYVLGTIASKRFGIHAIAQDSLARLSRMTGDTAFLSVPRGTYAVCLHREEGNFPIRTHVLQAGDRHPLGLGAGSLALLAAMPDPEIEKIIESNQAIVSEKYPNYSPAKLRELVKMTRQDGYALNPGMIMQGSWGIGAAVRGHDGKPAGALSIAAVEMRLQENRRKELVPLLQEEAARLELLLKHAGVTSGHPMDVSADHKSPSRNLRRLPRNPPKRVLVDGDG